jgi:hypothetical protein
LKKRGINIKKKLIICEISVLLIVIILSGCVESQNNEELNNEKQRFVGSWIMEGMETPITLYTNGEISGLTGDEFDIKEGKFVILRRFAGGYLSELYNYSFSNNDTKLVLINIDTEVRHYLVKQSKNDIVS